MVPTKISTTSRCLISVYNDGYKSDDPMYHLANADHEMQWDSGRFTDIEERHYSGLKLPLHLSNLKSEELLYSGISPDRSDCRYLGAERLGGDKKSVPLFAPGQYQYKSSWFNIRSKDVVQELPSLSTATSSAYPNRRHIFKHKPDFTSPISARVYKRFAKTSDSPHIDIASVETFSVYAGYDGNAYSTNVSTINWSVVDNSVLEFMVDKVQTDSTELVFNKDINKLYSYGPQFTPATLNDIKDTLQPVIGAADVTKFLTQMYPAVNLFLYNWDGANLTAWTQVSDFGATGAGDTHFILDSLQGEIIVNPNYSGSIDELLVSYDVVPMIEYSLDTSNVKCYSAKETGLARIISDTDRGSIAYAFRDTDLFDNIAIELSTTELQFNDGKLFTGAYYGASPYRITLKTINTITGEPVGSVPLRMDYLDDLRTAGRIVGLEDGDLFYTDSTGVVNLYFLPASLGESIGTTQVSRDVGDPTVLLMSPDDLFIDEPSEFFVYTILKDDPIVGRDPNANWDPPATQTPLFPGAVPWDPNALNGRRQILFRWDDSAPDPYLFNPNSASPLPQTGAYVPLHPISYTKGSPLSTLQFASDVSLPLENATDSTNVVGGYFVAGPRQLNLRVSTAIDTYGLARYTNVSRDISIKVLLSPQAKGEYLFVNAGGSQRVPLGWRLPTNDFNAASQLGGALFITINLLSGQYQVLDTGQTTSHPPELVLTFTTN